MKSTIFGQRNGESRRVVTLIIVAAFLLFGCSANKIPNAYGPGPTVATSIVTTSESPVVASIDTAATTTTLPKVALTRTLGPGAVGDDVKAVQQRLNDLKFDVGQVDGEFGGQTTEAIWAYQKLVLNARGNEVTGRVTPQLWDRIQDPLLIEDFRPRASPRHMTVFLQAQVAVLFVNNQVRLVSHVSSGDGKEWCADVKVVYPPGVSTTTLPAGQKPRRKCGKSVTPGGTFRIYRRDTGWSEIPLGKVYNPLYFNAGIALHGAEQVPNAPVSHGCVRFPMHIAEYLPDLLRNGDDVFVFDGVKEPEFYGNNKPPFDWDDPTDTTIPTTTVAKTTTTIPTTTTLAKPTTTLPIPTTARPASTSSSVPEASPSAAARPASSAP